MPRRKNDILQGTLALLVLKTLSVRGPMHGYGMTQHIQHGCDDLLRVEEGSLYPALHRMEQAGWIKGKWATTANNRPARVYALTQAGAKQLAEEQRNWARLTAGVGRVLGYA